ncbi:MAG: lysophospholipid acyltransferase family protein, partial [Steroidobacteraceae bacterium]
LIAAHHCNWEWLVQRCSVAFGAPLVAAYKPASWTQADRTLGFLRARFGAEMVPAGRLVNLLLERRGRVDLLAMVADQSPPAGSEQQAWLPFFGQPTAFFPGPGWIAARMGYEPYFVAMHREGRGRYTARLVPLLGPAERPEPGLILAAYVAALEAQVRAHPAQYLWAYNRWKRPRRLYD